MNWLRRENIPDFSRMSGNIHFRLPLKDFVKKYFNRDGIKN